MYVCIIRHLIRVAYLKIISPMSEHKYGYTYGGITSILNQSNLRGLRGFVTFWA